MFDRSAIGYLYSLGSEIFFGGAYILDFLILHKKPEPLIFKVTEKGALFNKRSTSFSIVLYNLAFHYSGIIGSPIRKEKMPLSDGYGSHNPLHIHHNRR